MSFLSNSVGQATELWKDGIADFTSNQGLMGKTVREKNNYARLRLSLITMGLMRKAAYKVV